MGSDVAVILALLVPALTGLTILAYKHPEAYWTAGGIVCGILMLAGITFLAWNLGIKYAYTGLGDLIPYEKNNQAGAVVDDLYVPSYILFGILAVLLYLCILANLPALGITASDAAQRTKEKDV